MYKNPMALSDEVWEINMHAVIGLTTGSQINYSNPPPGH